MFLGPLWVRAYTPPIGSVRQASHKYKSDDSTAGQPGPGFEPVLCGVQCISGLLLGRHQYNCLPNHPLPFDVSPLRGSNCPSVLITCRSPEAGLVPSPPREADLASNPKSSVSCVHSAF